MKEVIDSIITAEQMAEQIILDASEKASKINAEREAQSEKTKTLASLTFSAERKKAFLDADKKAESLYAKQIEKATNEANALKESVKTKLEKLVDQIVGELIK